MIFTVSIVAAIDPKASKPATVASKRFFFNVPSLNRCKIPITGGKSPAKIKTGYFPEKAIARRKMVGDEAATNNEGTVMRAPIFILALKLSFSSWMPFILLPRTSLYEESNAKYPPIIVVRMAVTDNDRRGNLTIPGVLNKMPTGSIDAAVAPTGIKDVASAAHPDSKPMVMREPRNMAI